ncbi:hypothetical protein I540_0460 [Mycobacteroides abscessus subsp. bolletii 1513]|uniref:Uncharacterized protein n=1 Tax=Mycobacteroides abscessus subsp. bolletii 1513 TaxID=1299321 RepID=X8E085_9MYCO|nr:hypothetical protein I540_0460 [Mycobacteroides abscessus subsp. bolletii 1513]
MGIWLRRTHGCRAPNCAPPYCGAGLAGPSMGLGPPNCGGGCVTLVPRLRDSRTPTAPSPASKIHPGRIERITALCAAPRLGVALPPPPPPGTATLAEFNA